MRREMPVSGAWLNIPVWMNGEDKRMEIFLLKPQENTKIFKTEENPKIFEAVVPVGVGSCDFYASIPMSEWLGENILVMTEKVEEERINLAEADDGSCFDRQLHFSDEPEKAGDDVTRPAIHFTVRTGWSNDPNGLIYDGEKYHLYFQYNPFGISWGNMSWGHATSPDLLHWTQEDTVMFPDAEGCVYSGCAIKNDRGCLGLPKSALIFLYTSAGDRSVWSEDKGFVQKIAYSLDNGETLIKMPGAVVPVIFEDSRDPKVFWHEESQAYIMILWLRGNEFGILRSVDLENWQLTDSVTLKDGWECPDLLRLKDEEGSFHWFFWAAEGYYYPGEFDGWCFTQTGERKSAYLTDLPYAAQTYSGVEDRVISIPWLRLKNDGRPFTGSYGIPVELTCKNGPDGPEIIQRPVRELMEAKSAADDETQRAALLIHLILAPDCAILDCEINGSPIEYEPDAGLFCVAGHEYHLNPGSRELLLLVDDKILEVFFDQEPRTAAIELPAAEVSFKISPDAAENIKISRIF